MQVSLNNPVRENVIHDLATLLFLRRKNNNSSKQWIKVLQNGWNIIKSRMTMKKCLPINLSTSSFFSFFWFIFHSWMQYLIFIYAQNFTFSFVIFLKRKMFFLRNMKLLSWMLSINSKSTSDKTLKIVDHDIW